MNAKRKCPNILPKDDCLLAPNIVSCIYTAENEHECGGMQRTLEFQSNTKISKNSLYYYLEKQKKKN